MKRKIFIIDSEPVVRSVVTSILEHAGHSVMATGDIQDAIAACKEQQPDLILTNVFLRGITGHDAMRLLKETCSDVPVLMVSGLPSSDVIQEWMNEDGFSVFPKPFEAKSLMAKIEEVLANSPPRRAR